ncbi:creatininase family protein [Dactylosporangium salmoneum]|uniref:Creatininase family protein n=1 Tax=Dactylosporangium salmoneum TaxID=53361 RepID=A0ABN3HUD2_9ACTN
MTAGRVDVPAGPGDTWTAGHAPWRLDALTRDEVVRRAPAATVVVPLGSTEQHAARLPMGTDSLLAEAVVERAVRRAAESADVLRTPVLPFGAAHHHLDLGAAVSLSIPVYLQVLAEVAQSLVRTGFPRVVFVNGHGGNENVLRAAADRLVHELALPATVAAVSYWAVAPEALAAASNGMAAVPGHAGDFEISLMLAVRPGLVRDPAPAAGAGEPARREPLADPEPPGWHVRRPGLWLASGGRTDDGSGAGADVGAAVLDLLARRLADGLLAIHGGAR